MSLGDPTVSRWVLALEMFVCFAPLSLFGLAVAGSLATGGVPVSYTAPLLSAAIAGPLGLAFAYLTIVFGPTQHNRLTLLAMLLAVGWTLTVYFTKMAALSGTQFSEWWRDSVLFALLPALGMLHLAIIGRPRTRPFANT
ncbi:MAG: hypothetical protein AAGC71_11915 [Pseudomonadota bacterium]